MPRRLSFIQLGALALLIAPLTQAQIRGGVSVARASFGGPNGGAGGFRHSPRFGRSIYFGDPFYYGDDYLGDRSIQDNPPVFLIQQGAPADPPPQKTEIHPLLIELQGDHYIRTGGAGDQTASVPISKLSTRSSDNSAPLTLAPTILIYRNGLREDVPQYAIVGKVIYARGNYWQDGYWTKNIEISALNLPATIQANQANGVKFILPNSPSEVVTRP